MFNGNSEKSFNFCWLFCHKEKSCLYWWTSSFVTLSRFDSIHESAILIWFFMKEVRKNIFRSQKLTNYKFLTNCAHKYFLVRKEIGTMTNYLHELYRIPASRIPSFVKNFTITLCITKEWTSCLLIPLNTTISTRQHPQASFFL